MSVSPVVKLSELALSMQNRGSRYAVELAPIAAPLGAERLGARLCVLPAGKSAFPFHCHHANDELFVILDGAGTLRFGDQTHPVAAGEVVVCPAGGAETAHQLTASADGPMRYLAISTMNEPDAMEYPDSGKVTVFAGAAPGGDKAARRLALTVRAADAVDYWEGEATD
ncbi:cupin domain-containing protein [Acuticoccus sp. M5D2P5]|uniref:cupin domain-containing protein n=1 Tax=Acuticoccus kalidii TaxID=2910977 RepID=UPI001F48169C|nr:cupin domain-containing protein [Acuticoccus kalidii]MCF3935720.1 cupin domain-containing protein [Acuticoccus kalidii]